MIHNVSVHTVTRTEQKILPVILLGNDRYVWCDNQVVEDVDELEGTTSYIQLCSVKFEGFLWSMFLPVHNVSHLY